MRSSKLMIAVVLAGVVVIGLADFATAGKKAAGQDLYKEHCKPCHTADSEHGEYTPMSLIQDQWTRFFDEKYKPSHEKVLDPKHDNKPVTETISDEDLATLKAWTIDHAADSEHPMTCG
jgi:cytochrome c553